MGRRAQPKKPDSAFSSCQPGVQGEKCTECMDGYKNFSRSGCTACNCDRNGSLSEDCNEFTHQCPCKVSYHCCDFQKHVTSA